MKAALKKTFQKSNKLPEDTPSPNISIHTLHRPTPAEILRYRYHHGVNLGSIFVLERWLHSSMFDTTAVGDSELDAVTASVAIRGIEATRQRWESHYSAALPEDMLHWLVHTARIATIRLPVGYFTLGPEFCVGTPFEKARDVYRNAWTAVKKIVSRCHEWGLGVLLDFHALPGGANRESHSGTMSGKAELWGGKRERELTKRCLKFIAREANGMEAVVGIQVCNEAVWEAAGLWQFYDQMIASIAKVNGTIPVYVSDAWNLGTAVGYALERNGVKGENGNPVIVDTHRYYTFDEKDRRRSPHEIIAQMPGELGEVSRLTGNVFEKKGACDVYVGEYSCTLDQQTWNRVPEDKRPGLTGQFGRAQSKSWQEKSCGSAFWTLSMDWMPGGDWGFWEQVENGSITAPKNLAIPAAEVMRRGEEAERRRQECMARASSAHEEYWDGQAPGTQFEHWRFADGWDLGWADARDFFLARSKKVLLPTGSKHTSDGGDKIGVLDLWVLTRMKEMRCADKDRCPTGWEFEQGFRQGISEFYTVVKI